ncbi:MAG TPA: methionine--tRNA ligase [Acidimicrobiales bacterium]|nr:methionine--tRNA ligase [Acidimicrobiales bacterium]
MPSTYLTVAIPYVNAAPHLGYAYELVLADIAARARRSRPGGDVRFLGGTDDYSLKNVLAAERAGVPTAKFVSAHAARFAALADPLQISFDDFIQTSSDSRHAPAIRRLWQRVAERGDLYRKSYQGQYCVGCEQFYVPSELIGGRCPEHGTPTERVEEQNWFFRLSSYQGHLERAIRTGTIRITPEAYRTEALAFVRTGLEDISVSRSARRARGWGIPVPGDPEQVIYVWFDALGNYLSALDYASAHNQAYRRWCVDTDERLHVIGKGILRFHAVYWPAFLASAGEEAPTRIHVHSYLSVDGAKISKSAGITVDPIDVVAPYGVDALRWWFAKEVHPVTDTDFSIERLVETANEDLAGGFANLVHRITTLLHRYRDNVLPAVAHPPLSIVDRLSEAASECLLDLDLRGAAKALLDAVAAVNRDLESTAPWTIGTDSCRAAEFDQALACHRSSVLRIIEALTPILPGLSARLAQPLTPIGGRLPPLSPAYPRLGATPIT